MGGPTGGFGAARSGQRMSVQGRAKPVANRASGRRAARPPETACGLSRRSIAEPELKCRRCRACCARTQRASTWRHGAAHRGECHEVTGSTDGQATRAPVASLEGAGTLASPLSRTSPNLSFNAASGPLNTRDRACGVDPGRACPCSAVASHTAAYTRCTPRRHPSSSAAPAAVSAQVEGSGTALMVTSVAGCQYLTSKSTT